MSHSEVKMHMIVMCQNTIAMTLMWDHKFAAHCACQRHAVESCKRVHCLSKVASAFIAG
jgi:hypothetical protein